MRIISGGEFARRLAAAAEERDTRYAFFLGAGCSTSSGIPAATALVVDRWLPRLKALAAPEADGDAWVSNEVQGWNPDRPAASYGVVIERLFLTAEQRQREIEVLCDGKFPGFGYAVIAALMASTKGCFSVALTTNFDDLLADALYLFTSARPLAIHHESLASFIRPTRSRPIIVKLHGDNRLAPLNTGAETGHLKEQLLAHVPTLLHDGGLIIMGYGGNDEGIASLFKSLPPEALPLGIYWVSKSEPGRPIRGWLEERGAVWVQEADFDEAMLLLQNAFSLAHPTDGRIRDVFVRYRDTYERLSAKIVARPADGEETAVLKTAVQHADEAVGDSWWRARLEADRVRHIDRGRAEAIFEAGLAQYPASVELWASYADFLAEDPKALDRAEKTYERALQVDPQDAQTIGAYAIFLGDERKELDRAEEMYERALAVDPQNANNIGNYAAFLFDDREEHSRADAMFKQGIAVNPLDTTVLGNYALVLFSLGEIENAEFYAKRAETLGGLSPEFELGIAFARFANGRAADRSRALDAIKQLLADGVSVRYGSFVSNVAHAEKANHDRLDLVGTLAEVIVGRLGVEALAGYPEFADP